MQIKEFLNNVCEQIEYKPIRNEISEELENHIEETKANYIENGLAENVAEEKAIEQMGDAIEIGKSLNKIHRPKLDWKLLIITIIVLSFGLLVAITRNINYEAGLYENGHARLFNAPILFTISCIIGIILSIGIYFLNYKKLQKYATITYILATIIGIFINSFGTIYIPILSIRRQIPVTLPMFLYIIAFIGFLQNINENKDIIKLQIKIHILNDFSVNIAKIVCLSIFSLIVMASESNALILGLSYLIISTIKLLQIKENRKKYITILWVVPTLLTCIYFCLYIGSVAHGGIIMNRLEASFNPRIDPNGVGWISMQQERVINSTKLLGPEENIGEAMQIFNQGTNQAFLSILANYGWIVSLIMVATVIIFSAKLIIDAIKIRDLYGKLLIVGISSCFILQSIFNLLMNFNLGVQMNINIPFISYDGFYLIINIIALTFILSIYRRKDIILSSNNATMQEN